MGSGSREGEKEKGEREREGEKLLPVINGVNFIC